MRILPTAAVLIAISFVLGGCKLGCVENVDQTLQNGWVDSFDVRIQRTPESCALFAAVAGANYVISSRRGTSKDWQKIATIQYDDPIDIPKDSVVIISERVAYAFLINNYLVTIDGGKIWSTWDVHDLSDWKRPQDQYPNWAKIDRIDMHEDGSGIMYLLRDSDKVNGLTRQLRTNDFGKSWTPQE